MTQHEDHTPESDETPAESTTGSEAHASGPSPQSEGDSGLTVEDILGEQQTDEAKAAPGSDAEGVEEEKSGDESENPYLDDLRRLSAEYANYRKRTESNREVEKQRATAQAVEPMLGVLDDLDRAEQHGDLAEGSPFATIAQKIRVTLEKLGLVAFGEQGEVFDPLHHEAIAQVPVPGTEGQTVLDVIERGYRIGDIELRPAKVAVAVNTDG